MRIQLFARLLPALALNTFRFVYFNALNIFCGSGNLAFLGISLKFHNSLACLACLLFLFFSRVVADCNIVRAEKSTDIINM